MNLKTHNGRNMLLYIKEIEVPHYFIAANIACIQVKLDLIYASSKLHSGPIMPLVYVLDCLYRGNRLHINVVSILPDKIE
jgi:hypothetical protein